MKALKSENVFFQMKFSPSVEDVSSDERAQKWQEHLSRNKIIAKSIVQRCVRIGKVSFKQEPIKSINHLS